MIKPPWPDCPHFRRRAYAYGALPVSTRNIVEWGLTTRRRQA